MTPLRTTSATEMSDTTYNLWCFVKGDDNLFPVIASSTISIGELKDMIKEMSNFLGKDDTAASLSRRCVVCND